MITHPVYTDYGVCKYSNIEQRTIYHNMYYRFDYGNYMASGFIEYFGKLVVL